MIDKTPLVMRNLASDPELCGTCGRNRRRTGRAQPGPSFPNFMPMAGVGDARAADELLSTCVRITASDVRHQGLDQHSQDLDRLNAINLVNFKFDPEKFGIDAADGARSGRGTNRGSRPSCAARPARTGLR
jgi:hypothetical protein